MGLNEDLIKNLEKKLECGISEFHEIGHGEHNINYCLISDKGKFVLRINANKQFNNLGKEFEILKKLGICWEETLRWKEL